MLIRSYNYNYFNIYQIITILKYVIKFIPLSISILIKRLEQKLNKSIFIIKYSMLFWKSINYSVYF